MKTQEGSDIGTSSGDANAVFNGDQPVELRTYLVDGPNNVNVVLENVNVQNSVQDLKLILQEYPFVSHFTSYHLEAITLEKSKSKKKKHKARKVLESRKLDPFASLETLPNNQRIRIVQDNYNPNTGRLHVRQLRYVLRTEVPVDAKNYERSHLDSPCPDTSSANSKGNEDNDKQNDMGELRRKAQMKILDASKKVDDSQLPIMGTLSNFFMRTGMILTCDPKKIDKEK